MLEDAGLAAYELNVSCPNTKRGGLQFGPIADCWRGERGKIRGPAPPDVKLSQRC